MGTEPREGLSRHHLSGPGGRVQGHKFPLLRNPATYPRGVACLCLQSLPAFHVCGWFQMTAGGSRGARVHAEEGSRVPLHLAGPLLQALARFLLTESMKSPSAQVC